MAIVVEHHACLGLSSGGGDTGRDSAADPSATSPVAHHPEASVWFPPGYTLTGGGAWDDWTGSGNMLVSSYPIKPTGSDVYNGWKATGKDNNIPDPAALTVWAIGIKIIIDGEPAPIEQRVFEFTSGSAHHPQTTASLLEGWTGIGGGAKDNYTGSGNMLWASYPVLNGVGQVTGWTAAGKDQIIPDESTITAYVIGIKVPSVVLDVKVTSKTGEKAQYPHAHAEAPEGYVVLGGGAIDNWTGSGSLLYATKPVIISGTEIDGWQGAGKEHEVSDPSTITAYCISLNKTLQVATGQERS